MTGTALEPESASTVTQQIADTIRRYPTLYNCRTSVLEHMLCSIGGGYQWINGGLIDPHLKETCEKSGDDSDYLAKFFHKMPEDMRIRFELEEKFHKFIIQFRIDNADSLAKLSWVDRPDNKLESMSANLRGGTIDLNDRRAIYPMDSRYSNLCLVPDDVKPDWLTAVREMANVVLHPNATVIGNEDYFDAEQSKARTESNRAIATKVLAELEERFPIVA